MEGILISCAVGIWFSTVIAAIAGWLLNENGVGSARFHSHIQLGCLGAVLVSVLLVYLHVFGL